MSLEFAIAFGGPLLFAIGGTIVAELLRSPQRHGATECPDHLEVDVDQALAAAQAAAHQAEIAIVRARERLAS